MGWGSRHFIVVFNVFIARFVGIIGITEVLFRLRIVRSLKVDICMSFKMCLRRDPMNVITGDIN